MSLSNSQKVWIRKNKGKYSANRMAKEIDANPSEIKDYLNLIKGKPVPKSFYFILILLPVLFFSLLEFGLRIFNYGDDYSQWVEVTPTKMGLNPDIGRKYFQSTNALPESIQDVFDKEKKENAFRVFVLGGSSAAGYPFMPLGSFSRYLDQRLKISYPDSKIEVVNISLTAVNSYTIRDFTPEVLEQKPDLLIIYAGHNEFYGALGVGSMESLGSSRRVVNFLLYLQNFKITQLTRDILSWIISLFPSDEKIKPGTLMARMAEDQSIALNSETYKLGLEQFRGNLTDIVKMAADKNVPVILGNLASNLKDQKPFISDGKPASADKVYRKARRVYSSGKYSEADSLFRFAKDLDLLRFRAPEDFNEIINEISGKYSVPVVDIDSVLSAESGDGIIGNNLMTDHLHPTLRGYQFMGKAFYEQMGRENLLPKEKPVVEGNKNQDSLTLKNYYFSDLDSVIADFKIKVLKNDYPFIDIKSKKPFRQILKLQNQIDSIAYKFVVDDETWIDIQQEAANYYLKKEELQKYQKQMNILIYQYPMLPGIYDKIVKDLVARKEYDIALKYARRKYEVEPDAFSAKWIGIILLSKNKISDAEKYLKESLAFKSDDEQVLYNLAGVYVKKEEYTEALIFANRALEVNPAYSAAANLKAQLEINVSR